MSSSASSTSTPSSTFSFGFNADCKLDLNFNLFDTEQGDLLGPNDEPEYGYNPHNYSPSVQPKGTQIIQHTREGQSKDKFHCTLVPLRSEASAPAPFLYNPGYLSFKKMIIC